MRTRIKKSARSTRIPTNEQPRRPALKDPAAPLAKSAAPSSGLPWPIAMVPLRQLKGAARNTRTHPKTQIEQIVNSIRHFGYIDPVLADENLQIIGGHARAKAAERVGLRRVPVIVVSGLSETEKRALALADNKIAENAGWQFACEVCPTGSTRSASINLSGLEPRKFNIEASFREEWPQSDGSRARCNGVHGSPLQSED